MVRARSGDDALLGVDETGAADVGAGGGVGAEDEAGAGAGAGAGASDEGRRRGSRAEESIMNKAARTTARRACLNHFPQLAGRRHDSFSKHRTTALGGERNRLRNGDKMPGHRSALMARWPIRSCRLPCPALSREALIADYLLPPSVLAGPSRYFPMREGYPPRAQPPSV